MNRMGLDMIEADSLDQVKGQCVYPLVSDEYRDAFKGLVRDVFEGRGRSMEFKIIGLRGRVSWLATKAVPLRDDTGKIIALLAVTDDITARKEAEEKLRRSEEFVRNILDTVDEGFIVVDRDYRIMTANKAYCAQTGMSYKEIIGRHCYETTHKKGRPCHEDGEDCSVKYVFESGEPHSALHRHADPDDNVLFVETKAYPVRDADGSVISVIETINNITERHLLEEERLKTQKLESIGTLAGGIAHDFNNLLQGVFGYISMARMSLDSPEKIKAMLEQAEEALRLSVNLTTQLLTFSKGGKPAKKPMRLDIAAKKAVKFALSGSRTDFKMEVAPDLWTVEADEGQISQVIQNIVINANEAMGGRGTVFVSIGNADLQKETVPELPEGGRFVTVSIKDTGTGISPENLARVFDPYFTTKKKGSGLGLATSYSIIRNHDGAIAVKSEPDMGSTFTIYLPAAKDIAITGEPAAPAPTPSRKGRILVMDDEGLVRAVAKEMIEALGHEVECAADGEEAVEMYRAAREAGRPFDAVILDLTVKGGMGGEGALRKLSEIDPDVVAVVSSGYADDAVISNFREHGFSSALNKPYKIDALRECLDRSIRQP